MACHDPAERAEITGTAVPIVYNLRDFNILVLFRVSPGPPNSSKTYQNRTGPTRFLESKWSPKMDASYVATCPVEFDAPISWELYS